MVNNIQLHMNFNYASLCIIINENISSILYFQVLYPRYYASMCIPPSVVALVQIPLIRIFTAPVALLRLYFGDRIGVDGGVPIKTVLAAEKH